MARWELASVLHRRREVDFEEEQPVVVDHGREIGDVKLGDIQQVEAPVL